MFAYFEKLLYHYNITLSISTLCTSEEFAWKQLIFAYFEPYPNCVLQQSIKGWKNEDNWIESWRCQLFFSHFTANHLLQLIVAYCCSKVVSSCKCIKDYRAMTWQYREGFQDVSITLKSQTLKRHRKNLVIKLEHPIFGL